MIAYFSGTGNSRYLAHRLSERLGDELLDLNARIKAGDTGPVQVNGRLVLVTPTYAWRIPRVVRDWLRRTELIGTECVWFVMSCGSEIGNADKYNRALCREKHLCCKGTAKIVMPENYIAMFQVPGDKEAREIVSQAEPFIDRAVEWIVRREAFPVIGIRFSDRLMSGPVNPFFYAVFVKAKAFIASDKCVGCGQCARLCPMNNIQIKSGKPVWGNACTHCMACICGCPTEAIEYGKKSLGKPRYHFEALFPE